MKRLLILTIFIFVLFSLWAQSDADKIIGYYYIVDPDTHQGSQVYISKNPQKGTYEGRVVWKQVPDKYVGYLFISDFVYDKEDKEWNHGYIYHPVKNNKYKAYLKFESPTRLKVRGYIGVPALGKSMYWTKETIQRHN